MNHNNETEVLSSDAIAITGMSCQVPGANTVDAFWTMIKEGKSGVSYYTDEELISRGISDSVLDHPNYVKASAYLDDSELFDADFFNILPKDAKMMDPQHRLFLHHAWMAIENANLTPINENNHIGIFAGCGFNTYLLNHWPLLKDKMNSVSSWAQLLHLNTTEHLVSKVAFKLNLQGPCINVQTACSTSLSAIHLASQSLLMRESDVVLAGGVSISSPQHDGYQYEISSILSKDGYCRPFSDNATGTIFGSGIGVIVMKRLEDAIEDRDYIYAVIKGSAMNNDGRRKMHFTSPSCESQENVIQQALNVAEVCPKTIGYMEAHGTGTLLGDPIEIKAASNIYGLDAPTSGFCVVGSVKANVGHLNAAAGVIGVIKSALQLKNQLITPLINFSELNKEINLNDSPFRINAKASQHWDNSMNSPRRSSVSSFGIGGTNVHMILESAPANGVIESHEQFHLLVWSAHSTEQLDILTDSVFEYLKSTRHHIADIAYTLQNYRSHFPYKRFVIGASKDEVCKMIEAGMFNQSNHLGQQTIAMDWLKGNAVNWPYYSEERRLKVPVPGIIFNSKPYSLSIEGAHDDHYQCSASEHKDNHSRVDSITKNINHHVVEVWSSSLQLESVGEDQHFYDMGGDSLMATLILTELEAIFPLHFSIDVFEAYPTIRRMTQYIKEMLEKKISQLSDNEIDELYND